MRNADFGIRNVKNILFAGLLLVLPLWNRAADAEIKIIEADSTYLMGDNDSKVDARRIAVQEAKRKALEAAGTYVESLTVVKSYQLTKDEVKAYSAGVLETEVVSEQMHGTTERPELTVKAKCKIDTDILTSQIDRYRENEDLKEQLDAAARENDDLKKERDTLVKQLAADKDKTKAAATREKLDAVLSKEETNDDTKAVWINIGSRLVEVDENRQEIKQADLDNASVTLQRVVKINPQNQGARFLLASLYQRQGDFVAAENQLQTAVQHHPSNPVAHMKLGLLLKEQGKYKEALREFHFVERLRPRHPMMLFFTGMTFKQMGKCGMSVQYLNRFLRYRGVDVYQKKKEKAIQTIEECGGERPGRHRRVSQRYDHRQKITGKG